MDFLCFSLYSKIIFIWLSFCGRVDSSDELYSNTRSPMILVNQMLLTSQYYTMYNRSLDIATYYYNENDEIEVTCVDESPNLHVEYYYAQPHDDRFKPAGWTQAFARSIRFHTAMGTLNNNSYLICKSGNKKVNVTFVIKKKFYGLLNLAINHLPIRPIKSENAESDIIIGNTYPKSISCSRTSDDVWLHSPTEKNECGPIDFTLYSIFTSAIDEITFCASTKKATEKVNIRFITTFTTFYDNIPSITMNSLPNNLRLEKFDGLIQLMSYEYEEGVHFAGNCSILQDEMQGRDKNFYLNFNGTGRNIGTFINKVFELRREDHLKKLSCQLCAPNRTVLGEMQIILRYKHFENITTNAMDVITERPESVNYGFTIIFSSIIIVVVILIIFVTYFCWKKRKTAETIENVYEDIIINDNTPPTNEFSNPAAEEHQPCPGGQYDYAYDRCSPTAIQKKHTEAPSSFEYDYVYDGMFRP